MQRFSQQHENIKPIFLKENSGTPSKPRNIGISYSTTDYIMFLDQDDEYTHEMCAKMYSTIIEDDLDLVICQHNIISDNNSRLYELPIMKKLKNVCIVNPEIISFLFLAFPLIWTNIYKKSLIIKNNICFPNYLLAEDSYFNLQYYCKISKVNILYDFIGYNHYSHDKSISHSFAYEDSTKNQKILLKLYKTHIIMLDFLDNERNKQYYPIIKNYLVACLIRYFLINKTTNECAKKYLDGVKPYLKEYGLLTRIPYTKNMISNVGFNIIIKLASINNYIPQSINKMNMKIYKYFKFRLI